MPDKLPRFVTVVCMMDRDGYWLPVLVCDTPDRAGRETERWLADHAEDTYWERSQPPMLHRVIFLEGDDDARRVVYDPPVRPNTVRAVAAEPIKDGEAVTLEIVDGELVARKWRKEEDA